MTNVAEKLAAELVRVTELRGRYEALRGLGNVNPEPAIYLMTQAINAGMKAAGVEDALTQIRAVKDLEAFTD